MIFNLLSVLVMIEDHEQQLDLPKIIVCSQLFALNIVWSPKLGCLGEVAQIFSVFEGPPNKPKKIKKVKKVKDNG